MNEEQNINQLPKAWRWVTFNDVCNKIGDIDHKMPKNIESGYPYVSTKDFTDDLKISFERAKYISREDFLLLSRKIKPEKGDIIFPRYGTIGKNILIDFDKEFLVSYSCAIVKPNTDLVIPKYIYLYSLSPRVGKEITKYVVETTQANIGIASIKRFVFPLPPITEQQQVVSKVEELFSEVDKGIEEIKTAQQQLKVYRHAILQWAFEGKLTNKVVGKGELPKEWKRSTIGEVCTSVEYGSAIKSKVTGKVPVLRMGNIQNGIFDWDDLVYTDDDEEINKYSLRKNDVLFNRTNSAELVGKTAIYKGERPAIFAGYLIRINRIKERVDASYLTYYLNSNSAKSYGNSVRSFGVNQSNINGTKLKTYPLPLPPLAEQQQIVQEIESRLSVCDKIEETITNSLKQAEALRQSILKKAFEGKLV